MTYIFDIYNENPQICIENKKGTMAIIGETTMNADQKNCIGVRQLVPWLNRKHSHLWNMTNVFKKLRRIIPIETFELSLNTRQLSVKFLKELIAIPELGTIQIVTIDGKQVESDLLKILMDWCNEKVEFGIDNGCVVPLDYHHGKAFKFSTVFYDDARWVKAEDLLTLENSDEVILNENNFTSKDINRLLKFWMESDLNMFREFHMWADILDMKEVLKDIMHVKTSRDGQDYSIAKASQKLKFLSIHIGEDLTLCLNSLDASEESFQKEYKVLELMEQRKKLKMELEALENGDKAQKLTMEIRGLTKKLDSLCDYFNDESAIISL
ncbi:hypothetical protein CAEBREN_22693 [Caenorhabditis brenneri]|uniref:Sdz-33 F-box domain-containing protein n=1 Tax=Caenorhabditis brenneri TaxID=135651 RepID=G0NFI0_CAEBE|nr:hypothetical protein CAEBREN_22693 [Caenorhabditis brenneri]